MVGRFSFKEILFVVESGTLLFLYKATFIKVDRKRIVLNSKGVEGTENFTAL